MREAMFPYATARALPIPSTIQRRLIASAGSDEGEAGQHGARVLGVGELVGDAGEDESGDDRKREAEAEDVVGEFAKAFGSARDLADVQLLGARVDDEPEPADQRDAEGDHAVGAGRELSRQPDLDGEADEPRDPLAGGEREEAAHDAAEKGIAEQGPVESGSQAGRDGARSGLGSLDGAQGV